MTIPTRSLPTYACWGRTSGSWLDANRNGDESVVAVLATNLAEIAKLMSEIERTRRPPR
jgi:hypothetical protein